MRNFSVGTERCLSDLRRTQSTCVEQDPSQSRFCTSNVARTHSGKMVRQLPTRGIYIYINGELPCQRVVVKLDELLTSISVVGRPSAVLTSPK